MAKTCSDGRISIAVELNNHVYAWWWQEIKTLTLKKSSSGPKTILGLITVALGQDSNTAYSPSPLVLSYASLLSELAPMALT